MRTIVFLAVMALLTGPVSGYADNDPLLTFDMMKKGKELFEKNCIHCHELDWPLRKVTDRAGWEEILTKMAKTGAVVDDKDRELILEYLLAKSTFQTQCVHCHGPERALEKDKKFQDWIGTVRRMVGKKPGLLTDAEIKAVAAFLTVGM